MGRIKTFVAVTATQPITPLFQLEELYKINLADERIARAKAGMPVAETTSEVEKTYYELLVARRQLDFAQAKATETGNKWLVASSSAIPVASDSHDEERAGIGLIGAFGAARFLVSSLYGVRPDNPAAFIAAPGVLMARAIIVSYIPARRATKVDPMVGLRYE